MKADIRDIADIKRLVDCFYDRVKTDELLAPIFVEKIAGDWPAHLDTMCRFWNAALFNVRAYTGNPFMKHAGLPLTRDHFSRWIDLFYQTIDEHFEGGIADEAKRKAMIMANTFYHRMSIHNEANPLPPL